MMFDAQRKTALDFSSFQVGARLLDDALAGIPSRTPVYAQLHDFTAHQLNIPIRDFYSRAEIMVPAILEVTHQYKLDVASITFDVYNIEAEGLGQRLVFTDDNMPDVDRTHPLIGSREDLKLIKTPDFDTAGRFTNVIRMHNLFQKYTGLNPTLTFCAPFSLAANLMGIERLIKAIYYEPDFVQSLMEKLTEEVLAPWILYQKERFPQSNRINGADAMASLPIINLKIFRKWVLPYIIQLRKICGEGVYVANWVGEALLQKPEEMLDIKCEVGLDWILGQDPDVEKLTPQFYKNYAVEKNMGLILGVGARFMTQSNPEQVVTRVKQYIEAGKPGGRFALYLCNLDADTPPENVRAAVAAVREAGKYP